MSDEHQPIPEQFRDIMNQTASGLNQIFHPHGFALLVFPMDVQEGDKRVSYISNCHRDTMITAMKEFIARNEGKAVDDEKQW
jgi:hypothetical protein